jgi:hypothetical protein
MCSACYKTGVAANKGASNMNDDSDDIAALRAALANNVCIVYFTKQDGSIRRMRATTDATRFHYVHKTAGTRKRNEDVTLMWDMDKGAWRSMRNDAFIEWEREA